MKKLEIIGDSIMQGVIYSEEAKRYKLRMGNKFEKLRAHGIEISNKSRMGATINKGYQTLEKTLQECDENTLVLFEFGGNDCDHNWAEVSNAPNEKHFPNTSPNEFVEVYRKSIETVRKSGAKAAIATLVPIDASKYMNWISQNLNYDNILHWLGDVSMLSRWQEYYNRMVENIARELKCPIIDLRSEFLKTREYTKLLCTDGIHPTQYGYDIIENILADSLVAL